MTRTPQAVLDAGRNQMSWWSFVSDHELDRVFRAMLRELMLVPIHMDGVKKGDPVNLYDWLSSIAGDDDG